MKIYHGTSYENAQNILKNGWNPEKKVWNTSDNDCVYFYYSSGNGEEFFGQEDEYLIQRALESAQITAAINHSTSSSLYVLSIDIDEKYIEDLKDYSCDGMSDVALEIPVAILRNKKIEYQVFENTFCPSLGLMYLKELRHDLLNVSCLTSYEQTLLKMLIKTETSSIVEHLVLDSVQEAVCV